VGYWGAALLGLLICTAVQAQSVHLVTGDDYAPFTGKTLPGQGMFAQVVRAAMADQGIDITLDWLPWNRGYLKALRGEYDATFPYVRSAEREAKFLYSTPMYVTEQHLFSRAGDRIELEDLTHLQGKRLCYPLGWQLPLQVQALVEQGVLRRHSPVGLRECARLLLLRRDDLFISDRHLGESALRSTGAPANRFHRSVSTFDSNTLHVIVSRQHPRAAELIERFDRGLEALRSRGEYQRLIENYVE